MRGPGVGLDLQAAPTTGASTTLPNAPARSSPTPSWPTTFGPATASATAGGVAATATAKVARVRWAMGDCTTVTCHGPGNPCAKSRGATPPPDCGHLCERPSSEEPGGRYRGTATATRTTTWTAPVLNDGGTFTEARATGFTADVREVQVVN
ncbi:ATP/GTP-binding protein [Streptomyces sp. NPDC060322]|uniref:ATP/GTP-binding protein n=1 Tax=Streptomyces sp. NPDC060322 TaxID=3347097 RepID=UPI00365C7D04